MAYLRLVGLLFCTAAIAMACGKELPACATGTPLGDRVFLSASDVPMFTEPRSGAPRVINQRATEALGTTDYRVLSPSYGLLGLCSAPGWTQVKIVEVDGSAVEWETGWIESRFVRGAPTAEQAAGLQWDPTTDPSVRVEDRPFVRANALRVLRDDPNCGTITIGSYSSQRPGQFFVTCSSKNKGGSYNVFFPASDSTQAEALRAPTVIDVAQARKLCEEAIRNQATNPQTVSFKSVTGFATTEHNNGNRTVIQEFSAQNAMGVAADLVGRCVVQPNGATDVTISER